MKIKPGGLLEKVLGMEAARSKSKICETCENLIKAGETALGCTAHDKLIIPSYPPYHGNMLCPDWSKNTKKGEGNPNDQPRGSSDQLGK